MPSYADGSLDHRLALSVKEAAAVLGVGERSVARLLAAQALISVKVGRRRLIPRWAVDALLLGDDVHDQPVT